MLLNLYTFNFKKIKNKNLIFGTLLTFGFLSLLVLLTSSIIEKFDSNSYIGKSISDNDNIYCDADVIIMGDSRANQGIDPSVLEESLENIKKKNYKVYNLGRPGMQAPFFYFVFSDYLINTEKKPKVLLMNISFYLLGGKTWMDDIYFSYYKPRLWQVIHAYQNNLVTLEEGMKWYLFTRVSLLRYRKNLKANFLELLASDPKKLLTSYSDIYLFKKYQFDKNNKGYLSHGIKNDVGPIDTNGYKKGVEEGYSTYLDYLKYLFDLAAKHKVHIIIYEFPWPESTNNSHFIEILNYYQTLIKKIAGTNPYIHFITYPCFWQPEVFSDALHLNQCGANSLSSKAADWIAPYLPSPPSSTTTG